MVSRRDTLGEAKEVARANAKRDGCAWDIWWNRYFNRYDIAEPYVDKDYWWGDNPVYTVKPSSKDSDGLIPLEVTPDQAELVQWILEDEEDRQVYPGSEESKISLWKMLTGRKK